MPITSIAEKIEFIFSLNKNVLILFFLIVNTLFLSISFYSPNSRHASHSPFSSSIVDPLPSNTNYSLRFNPINAYNLIKTQLDFGYRVPGTTAHSNCGDWIYNSIREYTDLTVSHNFSINKGPNAPYQCRNILGKLNPSKTDIIILAAHWDSRNVAEKDTINKDSPIPGANDGGSGVAVLIELARVLSQIKTQINAQIWFLFFDAEDQGYTGSPYNKYGITNWNWCEGSESFAFSLNQFYNSSKETINSFILLDMVGGTDLEFIDESSSSNSLQEMIFKEGRLLGFSSQFPIQPTRMSVYDDHIPFVNKGIPSIDLIINFASGKWTHHHKHSDDLSNIDENSLNATGSTIESFLVRYYSDLTTLSEIIETNGDGSSGGYGTGNNDLNPNWDPSNDKLLMFLETIGVGALILGVILFVGVKLINKFGAKPQ